MRKRGLILPALVVLGASNINTEYLRSPSVVEQRLLQEREKKDAFSILTSFLDQVLKHASNIGDSTEFYFSREDFMIHFRGISTRSPLKSPDDVLKIAFTDTNGMRYSLEVVQGVVRGSVLTASKPHNVRDFVFIPREQIQNNEGVMFGGKPLVLIDDHIKGVYIRSSIPNNELVQVIHRFPQPDVILEEIGSKRRQQEVEKQRIDKQQREKNEMQAIGLREFQSIKLRIEELIRVGVMTKQRDESSDDLVYKGHVSVGNMHYDIIQTMNGDTYVVLVRLKDEIVFSIYADPMPSEEIRFFEYEENGYQKGYYRGIFNIGK